MKRKNAIPLMLGWIAIGVASTDAIHAADSGFAGATMQQTGTITGRVSNAATNTNLEGAMVRLEGTNYSAITERDGTYRLHVPAGEYQLRTSYTGLDEQTVPLSIQNGAMVRRDIELTAGIYKMSPFTVAGEREGNAQAITLQRRSDGVKTIVSADAFGNLAGNPGDLLIRLPGVNGESVGGDNRFMQIRGLHQNLLSVTMDGDRIAEATSSGTTREFNFTKINADAIERIEVVKSPTPDMDGDSIGGAVNMVSKSAFDSTPERRIRGSIGAIWRAFDPRDTPRWCYSLSYSEVFGGKLAVAFNAADRRYMSLIASNSQSHQLLPNGVSGPAYTYAFSFTDFRDLRIRTGAGLKLDYKFSENTRFFINLQDTKGIEHESDTGAAWATNEAIATRDANGNLTGAGGIVPGYTANMTEIRPVADSRLTLSSGNLYYGAETGNIQFGGVQRYEGLNIDYSSYISKSKTDYSGISTPNFILRGIGFRIERKDDPYLPLVTQTAGPDITNIASYAENSYNISRNATWDQFRGVALNVKKGFRTVVPTYIKTGVRWRAQNRNKETTPWSGTYVGPDGVMGVNPATGVNDDNLSQYMAHRPLQGKLDHYPNLPFPQVGKDGSSLIRAALAERPQFFRRNVAANLQTTLTGDTAFKEDITAYYLMGNVDLGKLSVLGGVRVESTETEGTGAVTAITPAEAARRAAWVGMVTEAESVRRTIAQYGGRQTRTGEYRSVLPGLHFKFSPLPNLITRLGYSANIGRPGIGQLVPSTSVNFENQTVSSSNPSLKPQTANNFDLTAEYYFEPAGLLSVSVFLKEIKSFIYSAGGAIIPAGLDNGFDGEYAGYSYTTQHNGGFAKVKGIELSYSQQFAFLPGFWSGFGAYANLTRLETEGNYGSGTAISLAPSPKIAGFNPLNANAGISYIRNKVGVRLHVTHKGRFLSTFNANESRMVYRKSEIKLDVKTSYRITKHFDVYLDVVNAFAARLNPTEDGGGRPKSGGYMFPQFLFGVNGRL